MLLLDRSANPWCHVILTSSNEGRQTHRWGYWYNLGMRRLGMFGLQSDMRSSLVFWLMNCKLIFLLFLLPFHNLLHATEPMYNIWGKHGKPSSMQSLLVLEPNWQQCTHNIINRMRMKVSIWTLETILQHIALKPSDASTCWHATGTTNYKINSENYFLYHASSCMIVKHSMQQYF